MSNVLFMVESGEALEMVKRHISEVDRVRTASRALAQELGVDRMVVDNFDNTLVGVEFAGAIHPDFTKPSKKGRSHPKKGTEWAKRFEAQVGHDHVGSLIRNAWDVPTFIDYSDSDGGRGTRHIGNFLNECGFLWLSQDGPYAMWIPDVQAEVAVSIKNGYTVSEPALSFVPAFDGCRRIESEEWDILVAEHKLARKLAAQATEQATQ